MAYRRPPLRSRLGNTDPSRDRERLLAILPWRSKCAHASAGDHDARCALFALVLQLLGLIVSGQRVEDLVAALPSITKSSWCSVRPMR